MKIVSLNKRWKAFQQAKFQLRDSSGRFAKDYRHTVFFTEGDPKEWTPKPGGLIHIDNFKGGKNKQISCEKCKNLESRIKSLEDQIKNLKKALSAEHNLNTRRSQNDFETLLDIINIKKI